MWTAYQQAQTYRCKPSDLYGITGQPEAFYFDRAVYTFGASLDAALDKIRNDSKRSAGQKTMALNMCLNKWLGIKRFASVKAQRR